MKFLFFVFVFLLPIVAMADIASTNYVGDAGNIIEGTLSADRLPLGNTKGTVASGDDLRFETISVGNPGIDGTETRAVIWIE